MAGKPDSGSLDHMSRHMRVCQHVKWASNGGATAAGAARTLACARSNDWVEWFATRQKKPGPRGPGLKFASVGAPANHLPEGKNCARAIANLGGSRPRNSRSKACTMQIHPAAHNATVDMPAMRYLGSSGQLKRWGCSGCSDAFAKAIKRECTASKPVRRRARLHYVRRSLCYVCCKTYACDAVLCRLYPWGQSPRARFSGSCSSNSSAARWRPESRGRPGRARPS
jgi:hypothetical protein